MAEEQLQKAGEQLMKELEIDKATFADRPLHLVSGYLGYKGWV